MIRLVATLILLVPAIATLSACEKKTAQDTPQALLDSAKSLVKQGKLDKLTTLAYADTPEFRAFLDRTGETLGSLQRLGVAVQKAYPEEIAQLREKAEAAAARGEATSVLQRLSQANPQRRTPAGPPSGAQQDQFNLLIRDLFANFDGSVDALLQRATVVQVTDDTAALLIDNKPAFGVGLQIQRRGDDWYVILPVNVPPLSRALPNKPEGWQILGELMTVATNMLDDLRTDVETGKARRLDELAAIAGEKAFIPAAFVFLSYSKVMEEQRREERQARGPAKAPSQARAKAPTPAPSPAQAPSQAPASIPAQPPAPKP